MTSFIPLATANVGLVVGSQLPMESDQPRPPVVYLPTETTGYINPVFSTAD